MSNYDFSKPARKVYSWGKALKVIGILLLLIGAFGTVDVLIMEKDSAVVWIIMAGGGLSAWAGSSLFGALAEICAAASKQLKEN